MPKLVSSEEWSNQFAIKRGHPEYLAFYSSYLDMITTDSTLMQIPIDDHLVHRGHGVYDTGTVANGRLYQFRRHVDRLLDSARKSQIHPPWSPNEIIEIAIDTVRATNVKNCSLRLWISPGPGNFSITSERCQGPCLYILAHISHSFPDDPYTETHEATVSAIDVPIKSPEQAALKSINYVLNAKMAAVAKSRGGNLGIWVDENDCVTEGSICNVAIVTKNGVLITPPSHGILTGCTLLHIFEMLDACVPYSQRKITLDEMMNAEEVLVCGGDTHVFGVVSVNGQSIGSGDLGKVTRMIIDKIQLEISTGLHCDSIPI